MVRKENIRGGVTGGRILAAKPLHVWPAKSMGQAEASHYSGVSLQRAELSWPGPALTGSEKLAEAVGSVGSVRSVEAVEAVGSVESLEPSG